MARLDGGAHLSGVGGQLCLQPADLATKLDSRRALLALAHVREQRLLGLVAHPLDVDLIGQRGRGAPDGDRSRELARLDAGFASRLDRLGRQHLQGGVRFEVLGDEGAEAVARGDHAVLLQAPVDGAGGVDVDPRALGELAHARQSGAGAEATAADEDAKAPGELYSHGHIGGPLEVERRGGPLVLFTW
jgi:hypothetical protein